MTAKELLEEIRNPAGDDLWTGWRDDLNDLIARIPVKNWFGK